MSSDDDIITSSELTAAEMIEKHSIIFAKQEVNDKFPNAVDGLLVVHRRIIYTMRDQHAKLKSGLVVNRAREIHSRGDQSIYDTAVRMCCNYVFNPPLLDYYGDFGSYSGDPAAQARYTAMSLSAFAYDVFFKGIDTVAIHKQLTEDYNDYEPINLIPSIPTALIYRANTIGFGYGSASAPLNIGNVCDITIAFLNHMLQSPEKAFDYTKYIDKLLPDFPIANTITNRDELIENYKVGNFNAKITMDGDVEISDHSIVIFTLPFGLPFEEAEKKLISMCDKKNKLYNDYLAKNIADINNLTDSKELGRLTIEFKKTVDIFEAWEVVKRAISFSGSLTPRPNYSDRGYITEFTPISILRVWYDQRYSLITASKKYRLGSLVNRIRQVDTLLIVCERTDEAIKIIRNNDVTVGIALLMKTFDLTLAQAEYLIGAKISILFNTSKADLISEKNKLMEDLNKLKHSFTHIPEEMISEVQNIKKKYGRPRITKFNDYIGYVKVDNGCIQIHNTSEIPEILKLFPRSEVEIRMYDGQHLYRVDSNGKLQKNFGKITNGDIYGLRGGEHNIITVNIVDGAACCVRGFVPANRKDGYFYVTPKAKAVTRSGEIKTINVTEEISLRKTICRGANTDIIYVYPWVAKEHYVFVFNTSDTNVISIQRVGEERAKIPVNPVGEVDVIHSYVSKDVFINLKSKYLNRLSVRVVRFLDLEKLLDGKSQIRIDLGKSDVKKSKFIELI